MPVPLSHVLCNPESSGLRGGRFALKKNKKDHRDRGHGDTHSRGGASTTVPPSSVVLGEDEVATFFKPELENYLPQMSDRNLFLKVVAAEGFVS